MDLVPRGISCGAGSRDHTDEIRLPHDPFQPFEIVRRPGESPAIRTLCDDGLGLGYRACCHEHAIAGAIQSGDLGQMAAANQTLTQGLGRLLVISEAYPELRSNQNFMELQVQLEGTENRIATARQDYNDAVRTYNGFIRRFPQMLTAKASGAEAREYFEITSEEVRDVPTVSFD